MCQLKKQDFIQRMEWCPANGNSGFPVNIIGTVSENDNTFQVLKGQKEVYLAFAPYLQPRLMIRRRELGKKGWGRCFMSESGNNTLTYKGLIYNLKGIQFCQATHSGSNWPMKPAATNTVDMIFTYTRAGWDSSYPTSFLIVVPIYLSSTVTNSKAPSASVEEFFREVATNTDMTLSEIPQPNFKTQFPTMDPLFKDLTNKACVTYITCVQLRAPPVNDKWNIKSTNIGVVYFPGGWIIRDQNVKLLWTLGGKGKFEFSPFALPAESRKSWLTVARTPPLEGTEAQYVNEFLREGDNWSLGVMAGSTISVADSAFPKRFQWISDGVAIGLTENRLKTTSDYQCLPLNKVKDVKGKYVLMDPGTGRRTLKDELELSAEERAALEAAEKSGSAATTFAIIVGSILAGILLIVGASFLVRFLLKRVNTQAGVEAVKEAATHLTPEA